MRMLITGAAGFIGRYVAEEALRRGYRVTGTDRRASSPGGVDFVEADIRDKARMTQIMKDQDCVVHLAAVTSNVEFIKNPVECYEINASGFLNVIDAAARSGCRRFVYASSAAVYLGGFSEDAVIDLRKQGNHYAKTKLMNEMVAKSYERIHTMRATGLRFFNVYGTGENAKGDYASIVTIFLKARKNREPLPPREPVGERPPCRRRILAAARGCGVGIGRRRVDVAARREQNRRRVFAIARQRHHTR